MSGWDQERYERSLNGLADLAEREGTRAVIACTSYWYDEAHAARDSGALSETGYGTACGQLRAAVRELPGEHATVTFHVSAALQVPHTLDGDAIDDGGSSGI